MRKNEIQKRIYETRKLEERHEEKMMVWESGEVGQEWGVLIKLEIERRGRRSEVIRCRMLDVGFRSESKTETGKL